MNALELLSIEKSFGDVRALQGAQLSIAPGEIHALLGENGAGKSTLVAIASGRLQSDAGRLLRDGCEVAPSSPGEARALGIALVPQHDLLIEAATVADNLALLDPAAPFFERPSGRRARVSRLASELSLDLGEPDALVADLPVGTRQRIEIAGALALDPAILILDEPTAVLSPDEATALFASLRQRARSGRSIVLITHRVAEVFEAADRLTLLSRGRTAFVSRVADTTLQEVGSQLLGGAQHAGNVLPAGGSVAAHGGDGLELLQLAPEGLRAAPLTLAVAPGELVTLLAIDGNGADVIAAAAAGMRRAAGRLRVAGREVPAGRPRAFRAAGGAYVPGDRRAEGLVPSFTLWENLALRETRGLRLDREVLRRTAAERIAGFGIRAGGPDTRGRELSGGNQQKLLLARELAETPRALVAIHPTRGLDIAAAAEIRVRLRAAAAQGCAVLVATSDPDEALELGGPIRVVYRGELGAPLPPDTPHAVLGRRMAGVAA